MARGGILCWYLGLMSSVIIAMLTFKLAYQLNQKVPNDELLYMRVL